MMSQVGNCKKLFALCSLFLVLCSLTGCKDKGRDPESLVGNASRPTWTIASDYDFAASMTAVIKVDLAAQYPNSAADFVLDDSDLVAAFPVKHVSAWRLLMRGSSICISVRL